MVSDRRQSGNPATGQYHAGSPPEVLDDERPSSSLPSCPRCGGNFVRVVVLPQGSTHYSRRECTQCGKHLGWGRKPRPDDDREVERLIGAMIRAKRLGDEALWITLAVKLEKVHGWHIEAEGMPMPSGNGGRP